MSLAQDELKRAGFKPVEPTIQGGAGVEGVVATTSNANNSNAAQVTPPATTTSQAATDSTAKPTTSQEAGGEGAAKDGDLANAGNATVAEGSVTVKDVSTEKVDDMDDVKVLEWLSKKSGKKFESINEVLAVSSAKEPSEEERAKLQERFQADSIRYGLDKGLFDTKTLESYHADKSNNPRAIALRVFTEDQLKNDPELAEQMKTDKAGAKQEIEERFQDAFFEAEEDGTWRKKRGQQLMVDAANNYINNKYGSILTAGDAFEAELNTQQKAVGYKAKVDKVFSEMPETLKAVIKYRDSEGTEHAKEYSYKVPENSRKSLRDGFLSSEAFARLGDGDIEEPVLKDTVEQAVFKLERDKMISEIANAHASDMVANIKLGRKNIPVQSEGGGTTEGTDPGSRPSLARTMLQAAERKS